MMEVVVLLISLTGPDNQVIDLNPAEIVALREPRATDHFAKGTHCLVFTTDGKFTSVLETCDEVRKKMEAVK